MYKIKITFLIKHANGHREWTEIWADWDGIEEIDGVVEHYKQKEVDAIDDPEMFVLHAVVVETNDATDGKYQCGSCEYYFDEHESGDCPYCGSMNWVEGCIDEPTPPKECFNHCPNCDATDPDIEWGDKSWSSDIAYQSATCQKCNTEFTEIYQYVHTETDSKT